MSAEKGWIIEPIPPTPYWVHGVEAWAQRHRDEGHHPYPAPTKENPEKRECKCDPDAPWTAVWRILTPEQTREKFSKMFGAARARREGRRLPEDDPAWQERIRQAKQRVAERSQETQ
jgi:hypothetical protein